MPNRFLRVLAALTCLAACAAPPPPAPPDAPVFAGQHPTLAQAGEVFAKSGVQPGERLPALSLVDVHGARADLATLQRGRPLVLVTCSLTCSVARRQQPAITRLRERLGDRAAVVMLYTVDAHPIVDASPYSGDVWTVPPNDQDGIRVRQPATLAERCELARRYATDWAAGAPVLVDTLDNHSWRALGRAPNLGLVVDANGVVVARTGWLDAAKIEAAVGAP